jgi:hypothetical protein
MQGQDSSSGASRRPLRHVERLPVPALWPSGSAPGATSDAFTKFVGNASDWRRKPVLLSVRLTGALWCLVLLVAVTCAGLIAIMRHPAGCDTLWCRTATLGGHPLATLLLAASSLTAFAALAAITRGLTRVTTHQLVAVAASSVGAVIAVIGAVLVVVVVVVGALLIGFALFAALLSMARAA